MLERQKSIIDCGTLLPVCAGFTELQFERFRQVFCSTLNVQMTSDANQLCVKLNLRGLNDASGERLADDLSHVEFLIVLMQDELAKQQNASSYASSAIAHLRAKH
jgi:hypothetical protein